MSVVIPCYHEEGAIKTLQSLQKTLSPGVSTEVLVVVNDGENTPTFIQLHNDKVYKELLKYKTIFDREDLILYPIRTAKLPSKKAGVGLARKIGMDEAARRLPDDGIIIGFDADSLCQKNYLYELYKHFIQNPKLNACSIHFEHPMEGSDFPDDVYDAIVQYELHLRYFIDQQRILGLPFAYQTIGSSMAVRNHSYQALGGMNTRKAGEDFYFLQKFIKNTTFDDCLTTKVIPSPRTSDRVPFGTGKAILEMHNQRQKCYYTYHPDAYKEIGRFLDLISEFYHGSIEYKGKLEGFLAQQLFEKKLEEIRGNTADYKSFVNRFFRWFDAFRLMKALHFLRDHYYPNTPIERAVSLTYPFLSEWSARKKLGYFRKKVLTRVRDN